MSTAGPLAGIRVLELAGIGPGPVAARMLADFGAEVVRVARPGQAEDVSAPVTMRGRREMVLDLKSPEGVGIFLALCEQADVVIDPFRPGVTDRLGIGAEACRERNDRLVYAHLTGWGQSGPWSQMAGHDINYIAVTGVLDAIGREGQPPQPPLNLVGDFGGGSMYAIAGILMALLERERSGRGQEIDAAIVDGVVSLSGYIHGMRAVGTWRDERGVNRLDTGAPYYDVYRTADDLWMAIGAVEPQFWAEAVRLLELDDLPPQRDQSQWAELRSSLASRFAERTRAEWVDVFEGSDACVTPVLSWTEALQNPQVATREALTVVDGAFQPAPAPRLSRTPGVMAAPPVPTGHDTSAVLADWGVRLPA